MSNDIIQILKDVGGVITDSHIVYTSGKHGSLYINKDALYPHTELSSQVGKMFADKHKDLDIDVVAGPALGGIILSQWTVYHLSQMKNKEILGIFTEKTEDKKQIFKRGYDKLVKGKNVLIVEDLTTTGGSVKKVVDTVREVGGSVVAVSVMVNRDPDKITSEMMLAPFSSLGVLKASAYDENSCQLCKDNVPINTSIGHGKQFLQKQGKLV